MCALPEATNIVGDEDVKDGTGEGEQRETSETCEKPEKCKKGNDDEPGEPGDEVMSADVDMGAEAGSHAVVLHCPTSDRPTLRLPKTARPSD